MGRWMHEVPVPLVFTLPSSFRIHCSLSFEARGRVSFGDQSLKKVLESILDSPVSVLGCLARKDPGCGPPHGRRRGSGWEEGRDHGSCLDSGTGKTWAQIQTPLTARVWAYYWRPLHLHFHIYKTVTNISLEI